MLYKYYSCNYRDDGKVVAAGLIKIPFYRSANFAYEEMRRMALGGKFYMTDFHRV